MTAAARTEPLYPSEQIHGRLHDLARMRDREGYCRAQARHGRTLPFSIRGSGSDKMFGNSIYYRWLHPRGGDWYSSSPASHLKRYRKQRLRWLRISRDRSLPRGVRRVARSMAADNERKYLGSPIEGAVAWNLFWRATKWDSKPRTFVLRIEDMAAGECRCEEWCELVAESTTGILSGQDVCMACAARRYLKEGMT